MTQAPIEFCFQPCSSPKISHEGFIAHFLYVTLIFDRGSNSGTGLHHMAENGAGGGSRTRFLVLPRHADRLLLHLPVIMDPPDGLAPNNPGSPSVRLLALCAGKGRGCGPLKQAGGSLSEPHETDRSQVCRSSLVGRNAVVLANQVPRMDHPCCRNPEKWRRSGESHSQSLGRDSRVQAGILVYSDDLL